MVVDCQNNKIDGNCQICIHLCVNRPVGSHSTIKIKFAGRNEPKWGLPRVAIPLFGPPIQIFVTTTVA
jgi:hypothetical protein